jgi:hypothetical protein
MVLHELVDAQHEDHTDPALARLEAGIPLTLLLDLAVPVPSTDIYRSEPGEADWLPTPRTA